MLERHTCLALFLFSLAFWGLVAVGIIWLFTDVL